MEADIRQRSKLNFFCHQEALVYSTNSPVKDADQDLERSTAQRQAVLDEKQPGWQRDVCEKPNNKGGICNSEAEDS